jgi:hypothetical protein
MVAKAIDAMTAEELTVELKAEQAASDSAAQRIGYWMLREWKTAGLGRAVGDFRHAPYKQPPLTQERITEMGHIVDRLSHEMNRSTDNELYRTRRIAAMRERLKRLRAAGQQQPGERERQSSSEGVEG